MNLNQLITQLFDKWNIVKQKSHFHQKIIGIKERDIVFVRMGQNVGYEQDGKGDEFLRPVVIMKKFNKNMFLALPLTTKKKENIYHYEFSYTNKSKNSIVNSAILSQVKMFDTKRVKYKSGVMNINDFETMYEKFVKVTKPEVVTSP
ncbi:type II toxin-antitoxin system PemK/MazF family toxin [Sulfurimonas sp.]|uniref:type II toxin-antitoxin system PemK/MazF family toxin n=1 Tax=Sulfurimonas sp. TaxID=2022749 RepID=UPI002B471CD3|nr:type II toxin-antitoxin system PemK/MazF family toxin [Sulfurimonas sp.]